MVLSQSILALVSLWVLVRTVFDENVDMTGYIHYAMRVGEGSAGAQKTLFYPGTQSQVHSTMASQL